MCSSSYPVPRVRGCTPGIVVHEYLQSISEKMLAIRQCMHEMIMLSRVASLAYRDMWTFVTLKGGKAIGEAIQKKLPSEEWARDLHLRVNVPLV